MTTVWRTTQRYTRPERDLCDELARQVYLKLQTGDRGPLPEWEPAGEQRAIRYIKLVTANLVHDHFQSQGVPRLEDSDACQQAPASAGDQACPQAVDDFLRREVPDAHRQVFWLHHRHGLAPAQIAAISSFGLTLQGVDDLLARLRELLSSKFFGQQRKATGTIVPEDSKEVL
jgi:DNA-directed RNA polymerase specialized sigma24 family protein